MSLYILCLYKYLFVLEQLAVSDESVSRRRFVSVMICQ